MNDYEYLTPRVQSADPQMTRAIDGWLGLYEFNYVLARSWDGGRLHVERLAERERARAAEDPAAYGLPAAENPLPEHLFQALTSGAQALNELGAKYVVGGGLASNFHGQQRATRDVDFFILEDKDLLDPLLEALKQRELRPHLIEQPSFMPPNAFFWWVPLQFGLPEAPPVDVDLLIAKDEFMAMLHATGRESEVNGVRVRVLGPEALIVLKLQAFRDKDRWDAKEILKANPSLDRALLETWARRFKLEDRLAQMENEARKEGRRRFG